MMNTKTTKKPDGVTLTVSENKMSAFLELDLEFQSQYALKDLVQLITDEGIKAPIKKDAIQEMLQHGTFNEPVLVAEGKPPKECSGGDISWEIEIALLEGKTIVEADGTVDWKEQNRIVQVKKDQCLATIPPLVEGKPGSNIYGEPVQPKKVVVKKLPAGKNVIVNPGKDSMVAEIDGVLSWNGHTLSVSDVMEVNDDLNYETGNIHYDGTVSIQCNILSDFVVEAGEDIYVNGLVEGAHLYAGGNIFANGGIQGHGKAVISAKGDIKAKFIENATVEAEGDIIVASHIIQSEVESHKSVLVTNSQSSITGGIVNAQENIVCTILGSEIGTKTQVGIGFDVTEADENIEELEKQRVSLTQEVKRTKKAVGNLTRLQGTPEYTPAHDSMRLTLVRNLMKMSKTLQIVQKEEESIKEQIEQNATKVGSITAKGTVWHGTIVRVSNKKREINDCMQKVVFSLWENELREYGYKVPEGM